MARKQHQQPALPPVVTSSNGATSDGAATGLLEGLITGGSRGQYHVETAQGTFLCTIRGRLRKELIYADSDRTASRRSVKAVKVKRHDPVAVGDRVRLLPSSGNGGVIEEVVARAGGAFSRHDPDKGRGTLTTIAGLDQIVATFAAREPAPHLRVLDRMLVIAEAREIAAAICLTKIDLGVPGWLDERLAVYATLGYPVIRASSVTGDGLPALRALLAGRTSALLGPSGVGKSSLLNALQPGLGIAVNPISAATGKGRHTTRGTRLYPLDDPAGGRIADTAGFRSLALDDDTLAQLDDCFREFRPLLGQCRLNDCSHLHEPDCAIRAAVAAGAIDRERYDSYARLRHSGGAAYDIDDES